MDRKQATCIEEILVEVGKSSEDIRKFVQLPMMDDRKGVKVYQSGIKDK